MKTILLAICLLQSVMFWNLENFYDYTDGGQNTSDREFSYGGERHWTKKRYENKCALVSKCLLWAGVPDIIGFAEVENARVVKDLARHDILRKCGYSYIHYDSPDPRGIDVAMMYRSSAFEKQKSYPIGIDGLKTRDILYVCLRSRKDGRLWHIYVNHHPSKYGGSNSSSKRNIAMQTLRSSVDSLISEGQAGIIICMGDFNDTPDGPAFSLIEGTLVNLGSGLAQGSIRYHGSWQLIDNFLVSPDLEQHSAMEALRPPFLMERDRQYPGEKPKRTYIGPRYNAGVSDHLPVKLSVNF